jgi:hypothetical protein
MKEKQGTYNLESCLNNKENMLELQPLQLPHKG